MSYKNNLKYLAFLLLLLMTAASSGCRTTGSVHAAEPTPDQVSGDSFAEGVQAFNDGDYKSSLEKLQEYIFRNPDGENTAEAHLLCGKIYVKDNNCPKAEPHLKTVSNIFTATRFAKEAESVLSQCAAEPQPEPKSSSAGYKELKKAVKNYRKADDSDKPARYEAVIDFIDGMGLEALNEAAEDFDGTKFPAAYILYKRAALCKHFGENRKAEDLYGKLLTDFPEHALKEKASLHYNRLLALKKVETLKIGLLIPQSGKYKVYGKRLTQALDLAKAAYTVPEKTTAKAVEFILMDSGGEPRSALAAFNKLVFEEHVIAVIGPVMSDAAEVCAFRAEELGVPLVSLSRREGLPDIGANVFRLMLTNSMQMEALVDYAWNIQGRRSFAVLYPQHPYGEELMRLFWEEVKKRGGEIKGVESYPHDATMFRRPIQKLVGRYEVRYSTWNKDCRTAGIGCGRVAPKWPNDDDIHPTLDFDAIFIPDYYKKISMITPALATEDLEFDTKQKATYRRIRIRSYHEKWKIKAIQLLGANGWNHPSLPKKTGGWVEGSIFPCGFHQSDQQNVLTSGFVKLFKKEYGRKPGILEAHIYDAVGMVRTAVEKANPQSRKAMQKALVSAEPFDGVTGEFSFKKNGEMDRKVLMLTVRNGEIIRAPETMLTPEEWEAIEKEQEKALEEEKEWEKNQTEAKNKKGN